MKRVWRNLWANPPRVFEQVLLYTGTDFTIDVPRYKVDGQVYFKYGNTVAWQRLPPIPPCHVLQPK